MTTRTVSLAVKYSLTVADIAWQVVITWVDVQRVDVSDNLPDSCVLHEGEPEHHGIRDTVVDNLEEILSETGVEMVQWGPSDYSMSIGKPLIESHQPLDDPEVNAAKKKTFETALKMGVHTRAEINSADQAKQYLDMGVRHFSVGTDIHILYDFWKDEGEQMKRALEGE